GSGLAGEQDAARDAAAELAVALRVLEEVDDLLELGLGLLDAGDVLEGDVLARRLVATRARAPERHQAARSPAGGAAEEPEQEQEEEQRRAEAEEELLPPGGAALERFRVADDL